MSDEMELSGANYRVNDNDDTELTVLSLPYRNSFYPWEGDVGLYFEGVLGYAREKEYVSDIFQGGVPGFETAVASRWTTYGTLLGVGPEFKLSENLTLATILNAGVSRLENNADYSGPGAAAVAPLFNGIVFNWNALMASGGGAVRLDWTQPLGTNCQVELTSRYDIRWLHSFDTDDSAQKFNARLQLITLRSDFVAPTGLEFYDNALNWRVFAGYRYFVEGDLFGTKSFLLLGTGLELGSTGIVPLGPKVSLSGGIILGENVLGYNIGVGLSF